MVALHKEFVDVPIYDLKFIYRVFAGDYNICREFLIVQFTVFRNTTIQKESICTRTNIRLRPDLKIKEYFQVTSKKKK